jgi:hypothetical protein
VEDVHTSKDSVFYKENHWVSSSKGGVYVECIFMQWTFIHVCIGTMLKTVSCSPGLKPGLLQHLWQLPELRGATTLPSHLPAVRLPGHCSGHGGAAEGCQEPGEFPLKELLSQGMNALGQNQLGRLCFLPGV